VKLRLRLSSGIFALVAALVMTAAQAAPVSRLQVRIVTGGEELGAGSELELRIYEAGKNVRRLPLLHGEAWLPGSTHLIPLQLGDALDPRDVVRFSLYYHAANPLAAPWEVTSADVELPSATETPQRLLDATLSGVIAHQGELATVERDQASLTCASDADCDDHLSCNGHEKCAPRSPGADARGCLKGTPVVCPVNQVCGEGGGCRGPNSTKKLSAAPATSTASEP
jgi:hypothetical protein